MLQDFQIRNQAEESKRSATAQTASNSMHLMDIDAYKAIIQHDPDIEMLHGEYVGLNGSADFYARDIESLRHEGAIAFRVFSSAPAPSMAWCRASAIPAVSIHAARRSPTPISPPRRQRFPGSLDPPLPAMESEAKAGSPRQA